MRFFSISDIDESKKSVTRLKFLPDYADYYLLSSQETLLTADSFPEKADPDYLIENIQLPFETTVSDCCGEY